MWGCALGPLEASALMATSPRKEERKKKKEGQDGQNASLSQISRRSVKPLLRYGDFSIFQDGGRRHLGFSKCGNFRSGKAQEGQSASPCQISRRSAKPSVRYDDFSIFQDGGRPPSCICDEYVWITNEGHLVVFITVQNLVGIDAVVLIICMFFDFTSLASTPSKLGFGGI